MVYKQDNVDGNFEIEFYKGIIAKQPNFTEALAALGDAYTKSGQYPEGLEIDKKLAQIKPDDPIVLYNLACSYSLLKDIKNAFEAIKTAINNGYSDLDFLQEDEDLENLRADREFQAYFIGVYNNQSSQDNS